jgi:hypothetical protein
MEALEPRITLIAEVFSITGGGEGQRPRIKVVQDGRFAQLQLLVDTHQDSLPSWPQNLSKGDRVKLDGVVPSANYKGELLLKIDPHAISFMQGKTSTSIQHCLILEHGGM